MNYARWVTRGHVTTSSRYVKAARPEIARQILRKLLDGRLTLTPDTEAHVYRITGECGVCGRTRSVVSLVK